MQNRNPASFIRRKNPSIHPVFSQEVDSVRVQVDWCSWKASQTRVTETLVTITQYSVQTLRLNSETNIKFIQVVDMVGRQVKYKHRTQ